MGPGDEVMVPDMTFTATAAVISHLGAVPVLIDVDPATLNICLDRLVEALTYKTKAVIPVHYGGQAVDVVKLRSSLPERVAVVEGAAHCYPGKLHGRDIGGLSQATCFSFYANKTITTGEGGMFVTNDPTLYETVLTLSNHGRARDETRQFWPARIGFKYKMSNIEAAVGLAQAHGAAGQHRAHAQLAHHPDLHVDGVLQAAGEQVVVVGRRAAGREFNAR